MTKSEQRGGAAVLILAIIVAAAVGLGSAWWLAQPDRTLGQYDRLGAEIGCQCGTCPLRPIATCGCGFADGMLTELHELVDEGLSDDEVMSTFIVRYNESIRIKPASTGFDLTAWAAPIMLLTVGAVGIGSVIVRWVKSGGSAAAQSVADRADPEPVAESSPASRAREIVERDLANLDT